MPQFDPRDIFNLIVAAAILFAGRYFRNFLLDLWAGIRFLMGFVRLLAACGRDIGKSVGEIDTSKLQPATKKLHAQTIDFFERMDKLLIGVSTASAPHRKMDSELFDMMEEIAKQFKLKKGEGNAEGQLPHYPNQD